VKIKLEFKENKDQSGRRDLDLKHWIGYKIKLSIWVARTHGTCKKWKL
jgi:hypothetical protein